MKLPTLDQFVEGQFIQLASVCHSAYGQIDLAQFFSSWIEMVALKIYEDAPSCEHAEYLMTDAIQSAKKQFLEKEQRI